VEEKIEELRRGGTDLVPNAELRLWTFTGSQGILRVGGTPAVENKKLARGNWLQEGRGETRKMVFSFLLLARRGENINGKALAPKRHLSTMGRRGRGGKVERKFSAAPIGVVGFFFVGCVFLCVSLVVLRGYRLRGGGGGGFSS